MGVWLGGLGGRICKGDFYRSTIYKKYDLARTINTRSLRARVRRSDGHTDRRAYGQTVRHVQTARRSDGLRLSKAACDDLNPSDTV